MTQDAFPRPVEVSIPRALSFLGPQSRSGFVGRVTCDRQTRCVGLGRERLRKGRGECGKAPSLTQQVLDSPRLPVSHPQSRPNQSTGPQAHKHMLRHMGTHRHTGRHQHRPQSSTGTKTDTYVDLQSDTQTHRVRATNTQTQQHTSHRHTEIHRHNDTSTHSYYMHTVNSQPQALLLLKFTYARTQTHTLECTHIPTCRPNCAHLPTSYICQSWPRNPGDIEG